MCDTQIKTKNITTIAIFSALSILLSFLGFHIPFLPFLKIDASEVIAVLAAFLTNSALGITVFFVRNFIFFIFFSKTMGIGELINFILNSLFIIFSKITYVKLKNTKLNALVWCLAIGIIFSSTVNIFLNYFLFYPMIFNIIPQSTILKTYASIFPWVTNLSIAVLSVNLPFTILKQLLNSVLLVYLLKYFKSFNL
ncbi:MAG: ECF transporter S component [Oscillospiraceae bacterium]|nr:ECF transporter S component [Oscillospiraceae bacterium]